MRDVDAALGVTDEVVGGEVAVRAGEPVGKPVAGKARDHDVGARGEKVFPEFAELPRRVGETVQQDEDAFGRMSAGKHYGASAFVQGQFGLRGADLFEARGGFLVGCPWVGRGDEVVGRKRTEKKPRAANEERQKGESDTGQDSARTGHGTMRYRMG